MTHWHHVVVVVVAAQPRPRLPLNAALFTSGNSSEIFFSCRSVTTPASAGSTVIPVRYSFLSFYPCYPWLNTRARWNCCIECHQIIQPLNQGCRSKSYGREMSPPRFGGGVVIGNAVWLRIFMSQNVLPTRRDTGPLVSVRSKKGRDIPGRNGKDVSSEYGLGFFGTHVRCCSFIFNHRRLSVTIRSYR